MLHKLRRRIDEENGFTLIELLAVILIIGILAAIAIPAFLNQRAKAYDSSAKSNVKTAQIAEETYATDNNGSYVSETLTASDGGPLALIEPTLKNAPFVVAVGNGTTAYTVTAVSGGADSDTFSLTAASGTVTRSCGGTGGGCIGGTATRTVGPGKQSLRTKDRGDGASVSWPRPLLRPMAESSTALAGADRVELGRTQRVRSFRSSRGV